MIFHVRSTADLHTLIDGHSSLLELCLIIILTVIMRIVIMLYRYVSIMSFYYLIICIYLILRHLYADYSKISIVATSRHVLR